MQTALFKPSNALTFNTVESDRRRLFLEIQQSDASGFFLDLSDVTQCDSAGVALLVELKRLCKHDNKPFIIKGMPMVIEALAEFCGVNTILREV